MKKLLIALATVVAISAGASVKAHAYTTEEVYKIAVEHAASMSAKAAEEAKNAENETIFNKAPLCKGACTGYEYDADGVIYYFPGTCYLNAGTNSCWCGARNRTSPGC